MGEIWISGRWFVEQKNWPCCRKILVNFFYCGSFGPSPYAYILPPNDINRWTFHVYCATGMDPTYIDQKRVRKEINLVLFNIKKIRRKKEITWDVNLNCIFIYRLVLVEHTLCDRNNRLYFFFLEAEIK